jgi:methylase of polypeptide subunit release factors
VPGGDPPSTDDPRAVRQLQAALRAARFDVDTVAEALGAEGPGLTPSPSQVPGLLRSLPPGAPLSTLVKLFVAAVPVPVDEAAAALAPLPLETAAELNWVHPGEDMLVHPALRLVPAGPVLVACDLTPDLADVPPDVVIGVSPTSWALAQLTVRRPVEAAVDIGTGCGIQAMLAARHARRVVATDTNRRALEFARFSAAVSGLDNIEFLEGDLFEPVEGGRFDLVVCNPPFVVSPDHEYQYRDGGYRRDDLSRRVVQGAAATVSPGGYACLLAGWVHDPDGHWSEPLREWVDGLGCDAWMVHFESKDPEDYAVGWNKSLQCRPDRQMEAIDRWIDYYEAEGIGAIAYGAVVLRRRPPATTGEPWVRARSVGAPPAGPAGDQLAELFAAADWLEEKAGDLLSARLVAADDHRLEQTLRLGDGEFEVEEALLHLERALPFVVEVDGFAAELLARMDGSRTVAEVTDDVADMLGYRGDPDELRSWTAELAARLVELGFVHPAGPA